MTKNNFGINAASDLIAGIVVGGGAGYFIDRQFNIFPLFFSVFLIIGLIAGFVLIYRSNKSE